MTKKEYAEKVNNLRYLLNTLADELGARYSTHLYIQETIINDIINADLIPGFEDETEVNPEKGLLGNNKKYFNLIELY